MAETSIAVQPAATSTQPSAPMGLKMLTVNDGQNAGGVVFVQCVSLVDDQGRPIKPMREEVGEQLVQLLQQLVSLLAADNSGGYLPPDPQL